MNEVGLVIGDRNPHMKYIPFDLAPLNRARAFADAVWKDKLREPRR